MSQVFIKTTCQIASYGMKKPKTSGDALVTKSARHLRFNAADLGLIERKDALPSKEVKKHSGPKTTETFIGETSFEAGFNFLNKWDTSNQTSDYTKKALAYNEQKALLNKSYDLNKLEGRAKLKYYERIKPFCFKYYKVEITLIIIGDDGSRRSTEARTHFTLRKISQLDIEEMIGEDFLLVKGLPEKEAKASSQPEV